jgi:hypothetical protein
MPNSPLHPPHPQYRHNVGHMHASNPSIEHHLPGIYTFCHTPRGLIGYTCYICIQDPAGSISALSTSLNLEQWIAAEEYVHFASLEGPARLVQWATKRFHCWVQVGCLTSVDTENNTQFMRNSKMYRVASRLSVNIHIMI